jgi:PAS domain S-box-containing protein
MGGTDDNRAAAHVLRQLEELHRAALLHAPVGVAHVGLDGRWLWVNERLCALLGYSGGELRQLTFQDITYPEDLDADLEHVARLMQGLDRRYAMEKRYLKKDGTTLWVKLSVTLLRDDDGAPLQFVSVVDDISEEKKLAERLRHKTSELQQRNRELQGFTHSLAHELRGPIRRVAGYVEMIPEYCTGEQSPDLKRILRIIQDGTQRMQDMVEALLRLAEYGYRQLERAEIDMTGLVRDVVNFHLCNQGDRKIDIELDALPKVAGDRALLRHVWENLIANALKYTRNQVAPSIRIGGQITTLGVAEFWIHDNGVGFESKLARRIFEPFQRVCSAEFEGLGIGLALVDRIVSRHGGQVSAEGQPGAGARIGFSLPVAGPPSEAPPQPTSIR